MPFRSERQRRYLYTKYPKVASRWARKYGKRKRVKKKVYGAA